MAHIIKFCSQAFHHAGNGQNVTKPAHFWTFDSQLCRICNFELKDTYIFGLFTVFFYLLLYRRQSKFLKITVNLHFLSKYTTCSQFWQLCMTILGSKPLWSSIHIIFTDFLFHFDYSAIDDLWFSDYFSKTIFQFTT